MEYKKRIIKSLYVFMSVALAFVSGAMLWFYNIGRGWSEGFTGRSTLVTVGVLFSVLYYFLARMYRAHKIGLYRLVELTFSQMLAYGISDFVLLAATFFWFHNLERVRLRYFALAFLLQLLIITGIIFILNKLFAKYDTPRRILIVYGDPGYTRIKQKMEEKKYRNDIVGCIPDSTPIPDICHYIADSNAYHTAFTPSQLAYGGLNPTKKVSQNEEETVNSFGTDYTSVESAIKRSSDQTINFQELKTKTDVLPCQDIYLYKVNRDVEIRIILYCRANHIDVHTSMELDHLLLLDNEISHTFDTPFYRNPKVPEMWYYPIVKRISDIAIAALGLVLLSPIILVTSIAIKLEDHGPVFYRQKRLTKDGKTFDIIKFRSMRVDSEQNGAQLSNVHDNRITKVGQFIRKFRIDELPQLINILKGDMTIVGPRPERPEIMDQYLQDLPEYSLRLQVKAGLTGYAQVYGKYNTIPEDKLKLDLIYIAKRSLTFDIQIIFYTLKIIFIPESTEGIPDGQLTAMDNQDDGFGKGAS